MQIKVNMSLISWFGSCFVSRGEGVRGGSRISIKFVTSSISDPEADKIWHLKSYFKICLLEIIISVIAVSHSK